MTGTNVLAWADLLDVSMCWRPQDGIREGERWKKVLREPVLVDLPCGVQSSSEDHR